ncbi:MAG: hypothetical protein AAGD11_05105 [Planctomycetota bacterium]
MPTCPQRRYGRRLLAPALSTCLMLVGCLQSWDIANAQVSLGGSGTLGRGNTIPSVAYYRAIDQLYKGDYRDAQRTFQRELRGAIKIGVTNRWLDSIAYHALLGEVYYHQGQVAQALAQFDQACLQYLQSPNWMIRIQFQREPQADTNLHRKIMPWGQSTRQFTLGRFSNQELIRLTEIAEQAVRQGADPRYQPQIPFRRIDAVEIIRATALAIRRRNELLGPLGAEDEISRQLVTALSRGTTIPNHWSKAWADLLLGVAQAGVGKDDQAEKYLNRALLVAGQYDYPLTCVAMLELGRIQMQAGNSAAAAKLFTEANYSAYYYDDLGAIDDAFRLASINQLASGVQGISPTLESAAGWMGQKRYQHLVAQLNFAIAEQSIALGNLRAAQTALARGQTRLRDVGNGRLGNRLRYLEAHLQVLQERDTAAAALAQALQEHIAMSSHNLQLQLANQRYDQQQLRARSAVGIYQILLSDPPATEWMFRPLETLARLKTPHQQAFDRWLDAMLARKDMASALEITDLAKRHRYHSALAWGGRLAALRDALEQPESLLTQRARNQRNELLLRYPNYREVAQDGQRMQREISNQWQADIDADEQRELVKVWRQWDNNLEQREEMLRQIGLQRAAVDMQFPPILPTTTLQQQLKPGQAVAVFHDSPSGTIGFLVTRAGSTNWQCASRKVVAKRLGDFLRHLGNYDANHAMTVEKLQSSDWQESGDQLFKALFAGSSLDVSQLDELIVVPDGLVWYVPLTALPVEIDSEMVPLISKARIRLAPTVGLAVGNEQPWRRNKRTALVGFDVLPGDSEEDKLESLAMLRRTVENPIDMPEGSPAPTPILGAMTDTLVMLDEVELDLARPLDWSPIAQGRSSKQSSLSHWLTLPQFGPQRIIMPAARNVAERGGKISKRKSANATPGSELFFASCGLMSTGAQTILLSSWRVGGDATLELTREFLQELPYTSADAAWQRSVQVTRELPLNAAQQPRVKVGKAEEVDLTAAHPFFWAGYQLIDSGAPAVDEADTAAAEPVAQLNPGVAGGP